MAHPSYEVDKTYVAEVAGRVSRETLDTLLAGVELDDGPVTVSAAKLVGEGAPDKSIVELVIHEGRNRIVRRLLDQVGHPVRKLTRTAIGPVQLVGLKSGALRELTGDELGSLLDAAGCSDPSSASTKDAGSRIGRRDESERAEFGSAHIDTGSQTGPAQVAVLVTARVVPWQSGRCGARRSSTSTSATTCSSGWPRWSPR